MEVVCIDDTAYLLISLSTGEPCPYPVRFSPHSQGLKGSLGVIQY